MIDLPGMVLVWDALPEARVAGGAVRDWLVGRPVADVDFAVPLAPEVVMARAAAAGLKAVPTGLAHGTVTLVAGGRGFEVTTLRRDVATDGRHAVVAFTDDWVEDAARRDFTINAMSMARDGTVYDYFGGREDLVAGRVRFVGAAAGRITEDYLRVMRFFRFFAWFGRGAPDAAAVVAIMALRDGVKTLSAERVWSEVKKILQAPDPVPALRLMVDTGVMPLVLPGADVARLEAVMVAGAPPDPVLRVAALGCGDVAAFAARWRLSAAEAAWLEALLVPEVLRPGDDDAALRRALAGAPAPVLIGRTWLAGGGGAAWDDLRVRLAALERPVFPLQGRDLAALGVPAGPRMGACLREIRAWWLNGGCMADAAACRARVVQEIASGNSLRK
ncbi:CCA tRNA nucleotidyltransferase [Acidocella sp.]|uniref:CCA tRNA nucleotidyltransferase n=1 Tax=Acidocella sp. TaxID=50710 RepID=UPI0026059F38|nr:CCA tRNA nucleotidyltransferase [Acidocella sp.]